MKQKVLLDRSYAFYLLDYVAQMEKSSLPIHYKGEKYCEFIEMTATAINHALILFKKILVEDYYGSSLRHFTSRKEWFWDLFQVYSPDEVVMNEPELHLLIEDSVKLDLEDVQMRSLVEKHFSPDYLEKENFSSLIWNINRTLQIAKALDAVILPWPTKYHLYNYKFAHALSFHPNEKPYYTLKNVLDFHVPYYDVNNIENLFGIRKDERVASFRELIWRLVENTNISDREAMLQKLEEEKIELVRSLAPSVDRLIRGIASSPIPFPFNAGLEVLYNLSDIQGIKPYSWYFFLIDLRNKKSKDGR